MGLFNKNILNILILSQCFAIGFGNNKISEASYIDYSFLKNKESQFNLGCRSGGIYNYSIDKFISDNLIGSAKVSIIEIDYFQLINQLTFKFFNKKYPLCVFLGYNHYYTDAKSYGWMNIAPVIEFIHKNKYLSAVGVNYNLSETHLFDNNVRYFCEFKRVLYQDTSISVGFNLNPKNLVINKTIELNIEI